MLTFLKSILFFAAFIASDPLSGQRENPQHPTDTVYKTNRAKGDTTMENKEQPPPRKDSTDLKRKQQMPDSTLKKPGSRTDTIYRKIPPREGK
jgi:hypothetical protein